MFTLRFPFDPKTPIGYAFGSIVVVLAFALILSVVLLGMGIMIGIYGIGTSSTYDIQRKLQQADDDYKADGNGAKLIQKCNSIIKYSMENKELSIISYFVLIVI